MLAPLSIIAGLASVYLPSRQAMAAVVVVVFAIINGSSAGYRLFVQYPEDREIQSLYLKVSMDATRSLHEQAASERMLLTPFPTYEDAPVMRYLTLGDIVGGRILPGPQQVQGTALWKIFRDPAHDVPVLFLLSRDDVGGQRNVVMANINDMLRPGLDAEAAGRWAVAEARYRELIREAAPFGQARARLAMVLYRQGRKQEAREALARAGVEGVRASDVADLLKVFNTEQRKGR